MKKLQQRPSGPCPGPADGWVAGDWQVTAASHAGSSHLRRGEPCADRCEQAQEACSLILAVADGAGSAARGAEGAALTARAATRLAAASLGGAPALDGEEAARCDFVREVLRRIQEAVQIEVGLLVGAGENQPAGATAPAPVAPSSPADFQATLLLAILTATSLVVANVGDGWVVVRDRRGELRAVAPPKRGEYVNETFFLTSPGAIDDAVIAAVPAADLDAVALMSDGAAWFALDLERGLPSRPLFQKLFAFAADPARSRQDRDCELQAFLTHPAVCRRTDDDRTLMLAARTAAARPPADDGR